MSRPFLFRLLVPICGCVVGLLLAEGILIVSDVWIGRHSDMMFTVLEYDRILGWKMKPNIRETVDLVDLENIPIRSNSAGFWDVEFELEDRLHRCRIAFLGDSFTWGMGVREEERFTDLVEKLNPEWESLNFGVPGYGTDQSLLLWRYVVHRYHPNVVILTIYQNDYVDNMYVVRYGRHKPFFAFDEDDTIGLREVPVSRTDFWDDGIFNRAAPPYEALFPEPIQRRSRILHWLAKHSHLARLTYTLFRANTLAGRVEAHERPQTSSGDLATDRRSPKVSEDRMTAAEQLQARLLGALVKELAEEVEGAGGHFAVMLAGDPLPQYEIQKKALTRGRILYIDATTEVLARRLSNGQARVYYPYSGHWTHTAHQIVADLVSKSLREQELCRQLR